MEEQIAITLNNVSKCFKRYAKPADRLKEILLPNKDYSERFWALQDISLEIHKGQTIGIIGRNGSGKSTLLQIIAGTLTATTGNVNVNGRVSALLELGSGFNPDFTGRQNVFFNARLLGLSQQEIENKFDEIVGFADIGDFIDQPVKTYSSGMFVRLAFAVAVNVEPEILIIDEALAVGDIYFQQKCFDKLAYLREKQTTLLFVSHDMNAVHRLCDRAILLDSGRVSLWSEARQVIDLYEVNLIKHITQLSKIESMEQSDNSNSGFTSNAVSQDQDIDAEIVGSKSKSFDSGKAKVVFAKLLNISDQQVRVIISEQLIKLQIGILFLQSFDDPLIGFQMRDRTGLMIFQTNTFMMNKVIGSVSKNTLVEVIFEFKLPLFEGEYTITVGAANKGKGQWSFEEGLLQVYDSCLLKVSKNQESIIWFGLVNLSPSVRIQKYDNELLKR
ncbi:ABC transporter ATP-binding protein [Pseudanabaena sp. FACHB-1277]|jgi:lipopolysaccharide transport system ATP-binding protein|uniref:ABC transporter ATP-binding protein n=1 Tax=Pseudanabaena cinerea FACHB-1277 TaxID=2949581 RepID=A0A926US61_9CYAN|nr:ABC transporter ATP-binding protein [Pseudanabaena cinerea]MBD2150104.1 ABC transporter ATP-binding protein [Pseudanabaena cinerea FACHB-1277]